MAKQRKFYNISACMDVALLLLLLAFTVVFLFYYFYFYYYHIATFFNPWKLLFPLRFLFYLLKLLNLEAHVALILLQQIGISL